MAFEFKNSKGASYFLHSKNVTLKGGRKQMIYYFGKQIKEGALDAVPEGYQAVETPKTGMPILKKK
ncbi:MAG: hypothetical protein ACYDH3_07890 [Candidatus Aminicenantales bacterium]